MAMMNIEQLHAHPAYLTLTAEEQAAVDGRLATWHLDAPAVAATTGGLIELDASDLRFWLASTKHRPWAMISSCPQPDQANALFEAMLNVAPELAGVDDRPAIVDLARDLSRVLVVAAASKAEDGFCRDEQLDALNQRIEALSARVPAWTHATLHELADQAGLGRVADALTRHRRASKGVRGFVDRLGVRLRNKGANVVHGGLFIATGTPQHEGHVKRGVWRNWTADYKIEPAQFRLPRTEDELREIVGQATKLRAVGAGHSFNAAPLSDGTMLSLDDYARVLSLDTEAKVIRVQAGVRLRDLNKVLDEAGLALPVLGSTDAQSIAGLLATDLHGTGRDHGFLSEQIRGLRIVAADGTARTVRPRDPLFHAAIGGIGCCGVVTEVELQLVEGYRLEKITEMVDRKQSEAELEALLAANEHLSFYYVGGADEAVRVHRWNRTEAPLTKRWARRKLRDELTDFAISAFVPKVAEVLADIDEDAWLSDVLAPDRALVVPGTQGFGRKLFYRHDEIEFGVPFENYLGCLAEVLALLRKRDYFSIVETRFTPNTSVALLGPGVGRRTAYIELATPLSQPRGEIYARVEDILREHGGQPHLGKKTNMSAQHMLETYGERFTQFQAIRAAQDPDGKFLNAFTRQVFGAC